ncbi:aminotransferase class I/II-fold pyridoxal phosphate-dependent enzyme [Pseudobacteriovorax antillogorgiicola]|uniref:CDP-6-deoxy-D-xylo-4-hexulose-3-dehydrase n=1 Tax=Pseudobacteriovorax antillogorgiicola TaxID=1513793 RepID=A0A1Y6CTB5_9BACT|nr:aminotransferase class I/II-fold pyridoxal phosphate-dependent enzyme [Pseudobacteriovorax antillogorgiicola]TCS45206.1 CDP-6-deoxy-D-xylo-4-hexulose-3-dehydrase [Pseudobacteriovorax antillogorgiicola]SMF75508.1 CDP-6-deoxy-D-xylo-4-hexulose-3-dehydrase [Pseudobacteriovorax antillogorgiicola]
MENSLPIRRILFAKPVHGAEEKTAVIESLNTGWLGCGEYTLEFENRFLELVKKKHGVLVNSGSSANLSAISALNLPKGSEVITPACTFPTTFNPIIQCGLTPMVCDIDIETLNLDIKSIEKYIGPKTKAVFAPHAFGCPLDTFALRDICNRHNLYLVEDSADTIGTTVNGFFSGKYSDLCTFSFYATHHLTLAGGGGMLVTDSDEIMYNARSLKDWGRADEFQKYWTREGEDFSRRFQHKVDGIHYDSKYTYDRIGYNFKTIELQAAFGLVQLKRLAEFNRIRKRNVDYMMNFLREYSELFQLPKWDSHLEPSLLSLPITLKENIPFERYELLEHLENHGIQIRLLFAGNILRHEAYKNIVYRKADSLKNSDRVMKDSFLIGIHQGIDEDDLDYMCKVFKKFIDTQASSGSSRSSQVQSSFDEKSEISL